MNVADLVKVFVAVHQATWCYNPEYHNHNKHSVKISNLR